MPLGLRPVELIIILVIIVLLFGVGRISKVAGEFGSGIREFKKNLKEPAEGEESKEKSAAEKSDSSSE